MLTYCWGGAQSFQNMRIIKFIEGIKVEFVVIENESGGVLEIWIDGCGFSGVRGLKYNLSSLSRRRAFENDDKFGRKSQRGCCDDM